LLTRAEASSAPRSSGPPSRLGGLGRLQDCSFLAAIVLISVALYIRDLGFYSDDWAVLADLGKAADHSYLGIVSSLLTGLAARPVHALYFAALVGLFGTEPLGYHVVNTVMQILTVVLLYLAVEVLAQRRLIALGVALVYGLLPHYSTVRFWPAAFQAQLSLAFYFLGLYANLRDFQTTGPRRWLWRGLNAVALLVSTLAYEVALPLFVLHPLLGWWAARCSRPTSIRALLWSAVLTVGLLGGVVAFKAAVSYRVAISPEPLAQARWLAYVLKEGTLVAFGEYGLGLPRVLWLAASTYPNPLALAVAVLLGLAIMGYLWRLAAIDRPAPRRMPRQLLGLGLVMFLLGLAIFATNRAFLATTAGMANRTLMAAAVGVALVFVGSVVWLDVRLSRARRFYPAAIAVLAAGGFLINTTIASFWIAAYQQQRTIVADITEHVPVPAPGATLLLDGICPYIGPAAVFESRWDLAGALQRAFSEPNLRADVLTPSVKVSADGLTATIYDVESHYPYGRLFIYNLGDHTLYAVTDESAALGYLRSISPDLATRCPPAREGVGVEIF
jgi:hypothetical protein